MALPSRRHRTVAGIVHAWRLLTSPARAGGRRAGPGEPTLVACSGGADSMALVVALAAAGAPIVLAHVVHDLREPRESLGDRDQVWSLADRLGLEYCERHIYPRRAAGEVGLPRNLEAGARALRYQALADMARERGLRFVATAHHVDDQLESVVMALLRGTGAAGLCGMAESRTLRHVPDSELGLEPVTLIRPMLHPAALVTKADARRLCETCGVEWREDASNSDTSRLRAAVRARVLPILEELRPGAARRATTAARLLRQRLGTKPVHSGQRVGDLLADLPRSLLRGADEEKAGEMIRVAVRAAGGGAGADRLSFRVLSPIVRAIRDTSTDPRRFEIAGAVVIVTTHRVTIEQRHHEAHGP